ncbi:outer membrane receptor for monomeric catechols [Janthinobacterium sp. CG_23.3]|uniref:TonB-dependent receptor plug domain-containing protein n=1 Tax=Janthinobacterium sp. CG_23.3 TaxID=3349634 RepID=UPI0038D37EFF
MAPIKSRKHAQSRFNQHVSTALALMLLPVAAQAADAAAPQTMKEVKVLGAQDNDFKADKVSSPKLPQPLIDTPQTIAVIKKELIQAQGATSIMEALRNTPGITLQLGENDNTSAGDTFQMRGFAAQSSVFVDGVRDLGAVTRDAFNIEQIEVSKARPAPTSAAAPPPVTSTWCRRCRRWTSTTAPASTAATASASPPT